MSNKNVFPDSKNKWTPEEDNYLKDNYLSQTDYEISIILNRSPNAVKSRRLKVCGSRNEKHITTLWSEEEISFLKDNCAKISIHKISLELNRSEWAIKRKLISIFGTSSFSSLGGFYSTTDISRLLNTDRTKINYWIEHKGLPATKKKVNTQLQRQTFYYSIQLNDFYSWLKKNFSHIEIDFSKVNLQNHAITFFPEWFLQETKEKNSYGSKKAWTLEEEAALLFYLNHTQLSRSEISKRLNRSYNSIRQKSHHLHKKRINDKEYLIKLKNSPHFFNLLTEFREEL